MDYKKILKSLPIVTRKPPRQISQAELTEKAKAMTKRGYIHTEETLRVLEAYMQGYGILLSGGCGIGKTRFFECVNPTPIMPLSFNVCHLWKYEELDTFLTATRSEELLLDDVGWHSEASNYGQKFETLQIVLDRRLSCRVPTHITTNLTNDELCERFDGHIVDRIYQLCQCFALEPRESRREAEYKINHKSAERGI